MEIGKHRIALLVMSTSLLACYEPKSVLAEICVSDVVSVHAVEGRVVSIPNQGKEPIPGATIELIKCRSSECVTVAETTADEDGRFKFAKIKPGRYEMRVSATAFKHNTTRVFVQRPSNVVGSQDNLLIALDAGLGCGGWAKLNHRKPN